MCNRKGVIKLVLICVALAFSAGCTTTGTVSGDSAGPAIISSPGYYQNKNLGITYRYPADVFSVENELNPRELINREGEQKVPALVLRVNDIPQGIALDGLGPWLKDDLQAHYDDSNGFKVVESKMVKLKTGMDANVTLIKWRFQEAVPLQTACVSVYKNGKVIHVFISSVPGQPPTDILMQMVMALEVTP